MEGDQLPQQRPLRPDLWHNRSFSHSVGTTTEEQGQQATTKERETIVFTRAGSDGILAVHEHLSLNTF
jgi:hypothetical protein